MSKRGSERILIVGAGHAGGELATALRMEGYTAPISLVGEEDYLPYQRPPLSKAFLSGQVGIESLYLRPAATYEKHGIDLHIGCRVGTLDRGNRHIELADGQRIAYGKFALTTGGRVRRLPAAIAGAAERCGKFHYLRTINDVRRPSRLRHRWVRTTPAGRPFPPRISRTCRGSNAVCTPRASSSCGFRIRWKDSSATITSSSMAIWRYDELVPASRKVSGCIDGPLADLGF